MPVHILQYSLPSDKEEFEAALNGERWKAVVSMIRDLTNTKEEYIHVDDLRKEIDDAIKNLKL